MSDAPLIRSLAAMMLGAGLAQSAVANPLAENPIAVAVRKGQCHEAVQMALSGASSSNAVAIYLGGRMLDEGICVKEDTKAAAAFFARASDLGNIDASLEYATKIGLGDGFEQSYERAGQICRTAGVDPQSRLSDYSLGYACTLRGVAGRLLRERLPAGSFRSDSGALRAEFNPASQQLSIRETPQVGVESRPQTGSHLRKTMVRPQREIESAWDSALRTVPKPEAARLGGVAAELRLDVDPVLEQRAAADTVDDHTLAPYFSVDVYSSRNKFSGPQGN